MVTLQTRPPNTAHSPPASPPSLESALDALESAVELVQTADLDAAPADALAAVRRMEAVCRRLDHGATRVAGHLDASAAFSLDGHRNARTALKHLGRLTTARA